MPEDEYEAAEANSLDDSDGKIIEFLDSLEGYLSVTESMASSLRQGWFELASARHSMGVSRVSSASLDLKDHSASTFVEMTRYESDDSILIQPKFSLRKWASFEKANCSSREEEPDSPLLQPEDASQVSEPEESREDVSKADDSHMRADELANKERLKILRVFGTLVSPKLRATQLSFETALDRIIELASLRSSMLSAYNQLQVVETKAKGTTE